MTWQVYSQVTHTHTENKNSKNYVYPSVHCSINNSQMVEVTQVSIKRWMDNPWKHYVNWEEPATKGEMLCDTTSRKYPE